MVLEVQNINTTPMTSRVFQFSRAHLARTANFICWKNNQQYSKCSSLRAMVSKNTPEIMFNVSLIQIPPTTDMLAIISNVSKTDREVVKIFSLLEICYEQSYDKV